MMTTIEQRGLEHMTTDWQAWLDRWDAMQSNYLPDREHTLRLILDIVEGVVDPAAHLLDLGCGPGSLLTRARHRFPTATLTGVDLDPFLLELARQTHPPSDTYSQANYCEEGWPDALPHTPFDAVTFVSAVHYLSPAELDPLLKSLAAHLRPGGVLVIADTLPLDHPRLGPLAAALRPHLWNTEGAANGETWPEWWQSAHAEPAFKDLLHQRAAALADLTEPETEVTLPTLTHALTTAGFTEAAPLHQSADHHIIAAIR